MGKFPSICRVIDQLVAQPKGTGHHLQQKVMLFSLALKVVDVSLSRTLIKSTKLDLDNSKCREVTLGSVAPDWQSAIDAFVDWCNLGIKD